MRRWWTHLSNYRKRCFLLISCLDRLLWYFHSRCFILKQKSLSNKKKSFFPPSIFFPFFPKKCFPRLWHIFKRKENFLWGLCKYFRILYDSAQKKNHFLCNKKECELNIATQYRLRIGLKWNEKRSIWEECLKHVSWRAFTSKRTFQKQGVACGWWAPRMRAVNLSWSSPLKSEFWNER